MGTGFSRCHVIRRSYNQNSWLSALLDVWKHGQWRKIAFQIQQNTCQKWKKRGVNISGKVFANYIDSVITLIFTLEKNHITANSAIQILLVLEPKLYMKEVKWIWSVRSNHWVLCKSGPSLVQVWHICLKIGTSFSKFHVIERSYRKIS